jgi:ribosomal RNA methyltransferase Nop2
MSAAPGGKTSYIAQLMRNTGVVFANDLKPDRQKATVANMHRLGVKNVIACTHDGRKMPKLFQHYKFDKILLDAPCSGLGVISRDPSCKVQRTLADVNKTAHLQKELILAAIDLLNHKSKSGGIMVYSTCSVSVAENEEVVNYALSKRDIKIIDAGLDFGKSDISVCIVLHDNCDIANLVIFFLLVGKPGFTRYQQKRFHPSVALTRRFYPHVHNMDGFYVCKIQKLSDKIPGETKPLKNEDGQEEDVSENEDCEEVKQETRKQELKRGLKDKKKGKKRNRDGKEERAMKKAKTDKRSVPPPKQKMKKKKLDAKMTKPRRRKVDAETR